MSKTETIGFIPDLVPVINIVMSSSVSAPQTDHEIVDFIQLLRESENRELVEKLDLLKNEPTIAFNSPEEALQYLRSRLKQA